MSTNASETKPNEAEERTGTVLAFPKRYLRFGAFQVDLRREEIWRDGQRIKVQSKVFQTLLILLSRAGDVVTRDEVRKHLWPDDQTLKLDANVNTSMNKLRQALGDSPDQPTYIETIPRRGYCFVAPVEFADELKAAPARTAFATKARKAIGSERETGQEALPYSMPVALRIATLILAGMVVGALLVLLAWFSYGRSHRASNLSRPVVCAQIADLNCPNQGSPQS